MAATSPWGMPHAAEQVPESTWVEEETVIPVGTAAAGLRGACMSVGMVLATCPDAVIVTLGIFLIVVVAWLHVLLHVSMECEGCK